MNYIDWNRCERKQFLKGTGPPLWYKYVDYTFLFYLFLVPIPNPRPPMGKKRKRRKEFVDNNKITITHHLNGIILTYQYVRLLTHNFETWTYDLVHMRPKTLVKEREKYYSLFFYCQFDLNYSRWIACIIEYNFLFSRGEWIVGAGSTANQRGPKNLIRMRFSFVSGFWLLKKMLVLSLMGWCEENVTTPKFTPPLPPEDAFPCQF